MYNPPSSELIQDILKIVPSVKNLEQYHVICEHNTFTMIGYETSDFSSHDLFILAHDKIDSFIYFSEKKMGHIPNSEYSVKSVKKKDLEQIDFFSQSDQFSVYKIVQDKLSDFEKWKSMKKLEVNLPDKNDTSLRVKPKI